MDHYPIATAPKDGRAIIVSDPDVGAFVMCWNPVGYNDTFAPYDIGIWETPDKSMTWRDGEHGPTEWSHLPA